jgi:DNA-binding NarL/FixJ family response regulator
MRQVFETILVEPIVLLREGLALILNAGPFRILSSAASLDDCILSKLSQHQSVLLVIGADDNPDATATQIALFKEKQRCGRVAVLADQYKLCDVLSAFRAGAHAILSKSRPALFLSNPSN